MATNLEEMRENLRAAAQGLREGATEELSGAYGRDYQAARAAQEYDPLRVARDIVLEEFMWLETKAGFAPPVVKLHETSVEVTYRHPELGGIAVLPAWADRRVYVLLRTTGGPDGILANLEFLQQARGSHPVDMEMLQWDPELISEHLHRVSESLQVDSLPAMFEDVVAFARAKELQAATEPRPGPVY
jgi:hypothetical protein